MSSYLGVIRYKCPGCDNTYSYVSGMHHLCCIIPLTQPTGIFRHLISALHGKDYGVISSDATRVVCTLVGGKYVVKESQEQADVALSDMEEVRQTNNISTAPFILNTNNTP